MRGASLAGGGRLALRGVHLPPCGMALAPCGDAPASDGDDPAPWWESRRVAWEETRAVRGAARVSWGGISRRASSIPRRVRGRPWAAGSAPSRTGTGSRFWSARIWSLAFEVLAFGVEPARQRCGAGERAVSEASAWTEKLQTSNFKRQTPNGDVANEQSLAPALRRPRRALGRRLDVAQRSRNFRRPKHPTQTPENENAKATTPAASPTRSPGSKTSAPNCPPTPPPSASCPPPWMPPWPAPATPSTS